MQLGFMWTLQASNMLIGEKIDSQLTYRLSQMRTTGKRQIVFIRKSVQGEHLILIRLSGACGRGGRDLCALI